MNFFFNRNKSTRAVRTDVALLCTDFTKLLAVIDSCERPIQLDVAGTMLNNLIKKWGLSGDTPNVVLDAIQYKINNQRNEMYQFDLCND